MQGPSVNVNWVPGITLDEMEKHCILAAFRFYRYNKTATASALGITSRTLDNKLERYEVDAKAERDRAAARKRTDAETLAKFRGPKLTEQFGVGGSDQWAPDSTKPPQRNRAGEAEAAWRETSGQAGSETSTGVSVQPTAEAGAEHPLPVSQRSQVQAVLPKQASHGGHRSGRR